MDSSILIYGSGAMACLIAARLSAAGADVVMLDAWETGIRALQNGLTLTAPDGETQIYSVRAVMSPLPDFHPTFALVLAKSWQTAQAASALEGCLSPTGTAVTLQNGLGNLEILQTTLGEDRTRAGSVTFGATLLAPGHVRASGSGVLTLDADPRLDPLAVRFHAAVVSVSRSTEMQTILWRKALINSAINPLTALMGIPNGRLMQNPSLSSLVQNILKEGVQVAAAEGFDFSECELFDQVAAVCTDTADNLSSMLQDVQRGAPTEIDAICGSIQSIGNRREIKTPVLNTLIQLIHARTALISTGHRV